MNRPISVLGQVDTKYEADGGNMKKQIWMVAIGVWTLVLGGCDNAGNPGLLTKALEPGISSGADFEAWKEAGGLAADETWIRYPVKGVEADYTGQVLTYLSVDMYFTHSELKDQVTPSFSHIKEDLERWCGDQWKMVGASNNGRSASKSPWSCEVTLSNSGSGPSVLIFRDDHR